MEKGARKTKSIRRIAIIGPESTGKSTLAKDLALHYRTIFVAEYARDYVEQLHRPYHFKDVEKIAKIQVQCEKELVRDANQFIFFDTELIIIKIWFREVFQEVPAWIDDAIKASKIDLYLLCYPDLKWEFDPVRENPNRRFYLFNSYQDEINRINAKYEIIKGVGEHRLKNAIDAVNKL